jgi:hypothetical protein
VVPEPLFSFSFARLRWYRRGILLRRARSLTLVPVEREIAYSVAALHGVGEPESDELEHPATIRLLTNIIA